MAKGNNERIQRWKEKTYKRFTVYLRKEDDKDLIAWLEKNKDKHRLADIFRLGAAQLMKKPSE